MKFFQKVAGSGLACLVLAGCATIPVSSIYKLRKLDLATTDISKLRVAVQIPQAIRIRPAGVTMVVSARIEDDVHKEQATFVLQELGVGTPSGQRLPKPAKWTQLTAYRLSPADIDRMSALRQQIARLKKQRGDEVKGSLSIAVDSCARAPVGDGPVLITTWIKSEETADYVVLNRDLDLRREAEKAGRPLEIKPC